MGWNWTLETGDCYTYAGTTHLVVLVGSFVDSASHYDRKLITVCRIPKSEGCMQLVAIHPASP
jgi:hypothetical protein